MVGRLECKLLQGYGKGVVKLWPGYVRAKQLKIKIIKRINMPTIFSHPVPMLAAGAAFGGRIISARLLVAGIFCAILPDLDVIGFKLGIAYGDALGHRGASHSLALAFFMGVLGFIFAPWLRAKRLVAFLVLSAAVVSHISLDAMTSGGLGVAWFWPLDNTRYFFSWRPIRVSPLGIKNFVSGRGVAVLLSEFRWVWLPFFSAAIVVAVGRKCWKHWPGRKTARTKAS